MVLLRTLLLVGFFAVVAGCASQPHMLEDSSDIDNNASGAAYGGDIFYRKPIPDHSHDRKWEFFYKHCELEGGFFVSKREYACSDPY